MAHKELKQLSISTEFKSTNEGIVVCTATVTTEKGTFNGTSAANPTKAIEKMNPYEVAETSAVGRALGFAGYGIIEGIATADEMKKTDMSPSEAMEALNPPSTLQATCKIHNIRMSHFQKGEKEWWSHKVADGTWCNGRQKV
jgi:hypothetical protein